MDLIIDGHPSELEWLRREIDQELGAEAMLEAVPAQDDSELGEPIIISLIVALGGPVIIRSVRDIIKRRYEHVEEMRKLDVQLREREMQHEYAMTELRLRVVEDDGTERNIVEDELETLTAE